MALKPKIASIEFVSSGGLHLCPKVQHLIQHFRDIKFCLSNRLAEYAREFERQQPAVLTSWVGRKAHADTLLPFSPGPKDGVVFRAISLQPIHFWAF